MKTVTDTLKSFAAGCRIFFILALCLLPVIFSCTPPGTTTQEPVPTPTPTPQPDITGWTWITGTNLTGQNGVYGEKGITSPENIPGGRYGSALWTDTEGNYWVFGGYGKTPESGMDGYLNDLWRFDGANWTWITGVNSTDRNGTYGTKGIADSANTPGARSGSAYWTDAEGNFWLFGGNGYSKISSGAGTLQDLWKYTVADNTWTWVSGGDNIYLKSVFGTRGVAHADNVPGSRRDCAFFKDSTGNFLLFGGWGYDAVAGSGYLNDIWKWDGTNWTWIGGNTDRNLSGVYGPKGTAGTNYFPGGRYGSAAWTDENGDLFIFGGLGKNATAAWGMLNDLWKYTVAGQTWTWVAGSSALDQGGVYGTQGVPAAANNPGGRQSSVYWQDSSGVFWLFGGDGYGNTTIDYAAINDLWKWDGSSWTWVSGAQTIRALGSYGTQGTPALENIASARYNPAFTHGPNSQIMIFGGRGYASIADTFGWMNDLWRYVP
ncbi:MAG: hypothetical protein JW904_10580 [Spirochaetales bacterium]|nr:hypothetical protein [Spirochaetales bacterium]